jgi:hypothetical protein
MGFLDDYEPVEDRLRAFWEEHSDGQIVTELLHTGADEFIVRAEVYRSHFDQRPSASGLAHEVITDTGVNKTSALENCETSAIGRALANLGYAAKGKRPSREEMAKTVTPWSALFDKTKVLKDWTDQERADALQTAVDALAITSGADMTHEEADRIWSHVQGQYESRSEQAALDV